MGRDVRRVFCDDADEQGEEYEEEEGGETSLFCESDARASAAAGRGRDGRVGAGGDSNEKRRQWGPWRRMKTASRRASSQPIFFQKGAAVDDQAGEQRRWCDQATRQFSRTMWLELELKS